MVYLYIIIIDDYIITVKWHYDSLGIIYQSLSILKVLIELNHLVEI
jgi:hypothetical protein